MQRILLKSKIHRATVTATDLDYEGSIAVDARLLDLAAIVEFEQVQVYNVTNGERFTTYAVPAPPGSGEVMVNGAAARRAATGDSIIIASYAHFGEEEAGRHRPRLVMVDGDNAPLAAGAGLEED